MTLLVAYSRPEHQQVLRPFDHALNASFMSHLQGDDPATDFRGAGLFGLQNLVSFAELAPSAYHRLMLKESGTRAEWEYPFAAAGLNLTVMMVDLLHLVRPGRGWGWGQGWGSGQGWGQEVVARRLRPGGWEARARVGEVGVVGELLGPWRPWGLYVYHFGGLQLWGAKVPGAAGAAGVFMLSTPNSYQAGGPGGWGPGSGSGSGSDSGLALPQGRKQVVGM